jgi:predicted Fe-S protein YdhL (DUF1289 family)
MKQSHIESPCISVCRMENKVCVGCGRTLEEVTEWYNFTDEQKQVIITRLEKENEKLFGLFK